MMISAAEPLAPRGKLYFYDPRGGDKPAFKDPWLSRRHKQPVRLGWFGDIPPIYFSDDCYEAKMRDSKDKLLWVIRAWEPPSVTDDRERAELLARSFHGYIDCML